MSFKLAEAFVEIAARREKLTAGLAAGHKQIESFATKAQGRLNVLRGFALKLLVPLAGAGVGFIKLASDMQESESKFRAVFKDQAKSATEFSLELEKRTGAAADEVRRFMSGIQDTFVPMGIARAEASKLSGSVVELAYDLASFNNLSTEEVMLSLQSALVGNHETVRKFGVVISQAVLDQQLLAMGFKASAKGATEQEKIMARLAIIVNGTSDAQGDATRTAGSFANSFKAMIGQARQAGAMLGNELLPYASKFVEMAKGTASWFSNLSQESKKSIVVLGALTASLAGIVVVLPHVSAGIVMLSGALTFLAANPITILLGLLAVLAVAVYKATTDFDEWGKSINRVAHDITGLNNAVVQLDKDMGFEKNFGETNDATDKEVAGAAKEHEAEAIKNAIGALDEFDRKAAQNAAERQKEASAAREKAHSLGNIAKSGVMNLGTDAIGAKLAANSKASEAAAAADNAARAKALNDLKRNRLRGMLPGAEAADATNKRMRVNAEGIDERNKNRNEAAKKRLPLIQLGMTPSDSAKVVSGMLMGGPAAGLKAFVESGTEFKDKAKKDAESKAKKAKDDAKDRAEKLRERQEEQAERHKETRSNAFRQLGVHGAEGREMEASLLGGGLLEFLKKTNKAELEQERVKAGKDYGAFDVRELNSRLQGAAFESEEKRNSRKRTEALQTLVTDGVKVKNADELRAPAVFGK